MTNSFIPVAVTVETGTGCVDTAAAALGVNPAETTTLLGYVRGSRKRVLVHESEWS